MQSAVVVAIGAALATFLLILGVQRYLSSRGGMLDRLEDIDLPLLNKSRQSAGRNRPAPIGRRLERAVAHTDFAARFALDIAKANLKLTVSEYLALHVIAAVGLFTLALVLLRNPMPALLIGVVGLFLPRLYVKRMQGKRTKAFGDQLPDTLTLVVSSLRSGYSLLQSLEMITREAPEPSAGEFRRVIREVSLGLTVEAALANLVRRIESADLDMVVTSINLQHEVGGNMAEVLTTVAETIRERVRLKSEVSVITSQQRISGYAIAVMPIGLAGIIYIVNPSYMMQLFSMEKVICMPAIAMPICASVMLVAGFMVMRRIVQIEV